MRYIRLSLLTILSLLACIAHADDLTLSWSEVTSGESCTDAGAMSVDGYHIYRRVGTSVGSDNTSFTEVGVPPGEYHYIGVTYAGNSISRTSGVKTLVSEALRVGEDNRVYMTIKVSNRLVAVQVGTIAVGTVCDHEQNILGKYVVPHEDVVMTNPNQTKSIVMIAACY